MIIFLKFESFFLIIIVKKKSLTTHMYVKRKILHQNKITL